MIITIKDLERSIETINKLTNNKLEPYTRQSNGATKCNIGNYHLSGAYGGYNMLQISNSSGGCSEPIGSGHVPKRELYIQLRAFIAGLHVGGA